MHGDLPERLAMHPRVLRWSVDRRRLRRMPTRGWTVSLDVPEWAADHLAQVPLLVDDEARMRFVLRLARENVVRETGGPFAAAVVERAAGRVVAVGVNAVERLRCSVAHAEVIALALGASPGGHAHVASAGPSGARARDDL